MFPSKVQTLLLSKNLTCENFVSVALYVMFAFYSFPNYDAEVRQRSNFSQVTISSLRRRRHYRYCRNRHHTRHRYHPHCYYCFCVIVTATSGEEGLKSIMREIGLGKELGDSPQKNVVQFIGCVTSQSKKAILRILSFLLFEIYTYVNFPF